MIYNDTTLGHDLLKIALRHCVSDVELDRKEDHIFRKLVTFERNHCLNRQGGVEGAACNGANRVSV